MSIRKSFKQLTGAAVVAMGITLSHGAAADAFAQEIVTATVPVTVSVAATVTISPPDGLPGASGDSKDVPANTETVLNIVLADGNTAVSHRAAARGVAPVAMTHSRGNVSLRLSPQQYGKATISLFSVNGRRVLSGKADAARAGLKLSRGNVAAGVYLLSVKGVQGNFHSNRIVHSGGRLNIDAAFDASGIAPVMARMTAGDEAEYGEWTITAQADGYNDTSYTFIPVAGVNDPQTIALEPEDCGDDCLCEGFTEGTEREHYGKSKPQFCDERDGKKYVYQTIGAQTWMAENLNYAGADGNLGSCYNNSADSCAKYGRLYAWSAVMNGSPSSSSNPSNVQGICPAGWHVPSDAEWTQLENAVGGSSTAARKLKSQTGWGSCGPSGSAYVCEDAHDFSALSGGLGIGSIFDFVGIGGYWWSATEFDASLAYRRHMNDGNEDVDRYYYGKTFLFSVRCIKVED